MSAVGDQVAVVVRPEVDSILAAAIDAQREVGIRTAIGYLVVGNRGRAHLELVRSVLRQWRAACGGEIPIEPSTLGARGRR